MKLLIKGFLTLGLIAMLGLGGGCTGTGKKDHKADYSMALQDSIATVRAEIDSCRMAMENADHRRLEWSDDFITVANDREAAPYMIYNSFVDKYPPQSTCIIARLAENGQFELIGALTGSRFDRLTVTAAGESAETDVIAPDQARNYMAGGLNTVMFDGPGADAVGHLIADNELDDITVTFMNNGRPVRSWKVPADNARMIMATYEYYSILRDINSMQLRIPMLERKIKILQRHIPQSENAGKNGASE